MPERKRSILANYSEEEYEFVKTAARLEGTNPTRFSKNATLKAASDVFTGKDGVERVQRRLDQLDKERIILQRAIEQPQDKPQPN